MMQVNAYVKIPNNTQVCYVCKTVKPFNDFHKGITKCKACRKEYNAKRYQNKKQDETDAMNVLN